MAGGGERRRRRRQAAATQHGLPRKNPEIGDGSTCPAGRPFGPAPGESRAGST